MQFGECFVKLKKNGYIIDILYWFAGCSIYALAVAMLLTPNEITPGGFTGISTAVKTLTGIPSGTILMLLNIPLLIVQYKKFGGGFILKTVAATFILSICLNIAESVLPKYKINPILAAVFGGIISGFGLSLILLRGATTGGVDVVAMLINSRYRHLSIGRIIMLFDFIVIAFAVIVYGNIESALYSLITIYAASKIMDSVLYGADKGKLLFVVSEKSAEISKLVGSELGRGTTLLSARGGFTGNSQNVLLCAVRAHEVAELHKIIFQTDDKAFIMVADAGEIIGQGFKSK